MTNSTRLLLAVVPRLLRDSLATLLRGEEGLHLLGEAGTAAEALQRVVRLQPDVTVVDLDLPGAVGEEVVQRIRRSGMPTRVVALTDHQDVSWRQRVLEAGAQSCLSKDSSPEQLVLAVRAVSRSNAAVEMLATGEDGLPLRPGGLMTPREREVAVLLADGYTTREAASVLGISPRTAEAHRAAIMRKLDARNVADVVKYCLRNRLIDF